MDKIESGRGRSRDQHRGPRTRKAIRGFLLQYAQWRHLQRGIPYCTTLAAARASALAIRALRQESIGVRSLQEIHGLD